MNVWNLQQTDETIAERYRNQPVMTPERQARLEADTQDYYRERRLKAIRRYLKERAAR